MWPRSAFNRAAPPLQKPSHFASPPTPDRDANRRDRNYVPHAFLRGDWRTPLGQFPPIPPLFPPKALPAGTTLQPTPCAAPPPHPSAEAESLQRRSPEFQSRSSLVDQPHILIMMPDPKPFHDFSVPSGQSAVVASNASRPKGTYLLET